ncbi:hypothetical protein LPB140_11310 [Sphingorhabdus lutea]|uniref:Uncharacterized protein n=1 Tax=Sphingorhabdus lutea TaxID=1913578 RepID=A0A1L3JDZ3_9SPHN|nr:hypothetical protein [Sphingorhabdus lutea]APG63273.1 hypothetical protein LPB140_11310 [Sphingorhabdus lutea]
MDMDFPHHRLNRTEIEIGKNSTAVVAPNSIHQIISIARNRQNACPTTSLYNGNDSAEILALHPMFNNDDIIDNRLAFFAGRQNIAMTSKNKSPAYCGSFLPKNARGVMDNNQDVNKGKIAINPDALTNGNNMDVKQHHNNLSQNS